jgi:hypothetical protein
VHVLFRHLAFAHAHAAEAVERLHDVAHERLGGGGARGQADAVDAREPVGPDVPGVAHEPRGAAGTLGDLDQALGV